MHQETRTLYIHLLHSVHGVLMLMLLLLLLLLQACMLLCAQHQ
jgi:hypothetical protein